MKKREFLGVLQRELYNLPQNELEEQLAFYSEMIDDGIEEGLTEDDAVAKIGSVSEILSQINKPTRARKTTEKVKRDNKDSKDNKALFIALLIVGSPVWIALLSVAFVIFVFTYAVIWSLWISFIAVEIALAAGGVYALVAPIVFTVNGQWKLGVGVLGAGMVSAGLSILLWIPCKKSVLFAGMLSKEIFLFTKKLLFTRRIVI